MAFLIRKSLYLITFKGKAKRARDSATREEMKYRSKEQEFHMFL